MKNNIKNASLSLILVALLTACGGGSSGNQDNSDKDNNDGKDKFSVSISGQAMNSYIKGAKVCFDLDKSLKCDAKEPYDMTGAKGEYTVNLTSEQAKKIDGFASLLLEPTANSVVVKSSGEVKRKFTAKFTATPPSEMKNIKQNTMNINAITTLANEMAKLKGVKVEDKAFQKSFEAKTGIDLSKQVDYIDESSAEAMQHFKVSSILLKTSLVSGESIADFAKKMNKTEATSFSDVVNEIANEASPTNKAIIQGVKKTYDNIKNAKDLEGKKDTLDIAVDKKIEEVEKKAKDNPNKEVVFEPIDLKDITKEEPKKPIPPKDPDDNTTTPDTNQIVGRVMDGYISGATVFFDLNMNLSYDSGEPSTTTNQYGQYTLNLSKEQFDKIDMMHSVVALGDGVDVDTGKAFTTKLMATPRKRDVENLIYISPLSTFRTMTALNIAQGKISGIGMTDFQDELANIFDVDVKVSKQLNYIKENNVPYFRVNNVLQKAVEISGVSYDEFAGMVEKGISFDDLLAKLSKARAIANMKEFYYGVKQTHMNEKKVSISKEVSKKIANKEENFTDIDIDKLPADASVNDVDDKNPIVVEIESIKRKGTLFSKYKNDATIFFDLNRNFVLDADEPNTKSKQDGSFTIEIPSKHLDLIRSVVAINGKNDKNEVSKDILFATMRETQPHTYINTFTSYQTGTAYAIMEHLAKDIELGDGGAFVKGIEASLKIPSDSFSTDDSNNKLALTINAYVRAIANTYDSEDSDELKIFKAYKYLSANTVSEDHNASEFGFDKVVERFNIKNPLSNNGETFANHLDKISQAVNSGNSDKVEQLIEDSKKFRQIKKIAEDKIYNKLPKDEFSKFQWHLFDQGAVINAKGISSVGGHDLGVDALYTKDIVGEGVHVRIVDDGVEAAHEDLKGRIDVSKSFNSETKEKDPTSTKLEDTHGTQVAGLIGADGSNSIGLRGVAPYAKLSAFKLQTPGGGALDYTYEELGEAWLGGGDDVVIVNNSWGSPADKYIEEEKYLKQGAETMRVVNGKALGRIYMIAAGNGGFNNDKGKKRVDDATTSYFRGSQYAITVAAVRNENIVTQYSAQGSSVLVSSYGGGIAPRSSALMTTTTVTGTSHNTWKADTKKAYTFAFNGTSAATPVASGALALVMQECPNLSYRDVKWLIAQTAKKIDVDYNGKTIAAPNVPPFATLTGTDPYQGFGYIENGANNYYDSSKKLSHSNYYGYGLINPALMIEKCKSGYKPLPTKKTIKVVNNNTGFINMINNDNRLLEKVRVNKSDISPKNQLDKIEWVGLTVHGDIKNLPKFSMILISPSGTKSRILTNSKNAINEILELENGYRFSSVAFVDENPYGEWTLMAQSDDEEATGIITRLELEVVGYKSTER